MYYSDEALLAEAAPGLATEQDLAVNCLQELARGETATPV
jgi:hypothetical protein